MDVPSARPSRRIGEISREVGDVSPGEWLPPCNRDGWKAAADAMWDTAQVGSERILWLRAAICHASLAHRTPVEFGRWCAERHIARTTAKRAADCFAVYYPRQASVVARPPAGSQDYKRAMARAATDSLRVEGISFQHHLEALTVADPAQRAALLDHAAAGAWGLARLRRELRAIRPQPVQLPLPATTDTAVAVMATFADPAAAIRAAFADPAVARQVLGDLAAAVLAALGAAWWRKYQSTTRRPPLMAQGSA